MIIIQNSRVQMMKIHDKISKIAEWIRYESNSSIDEIEHLLYAIYHKKISGLSGDIDDDYKDILDIMYNKKGD